MHPLEAYLRMQETKRARTYLRFLLLLFFSDSEIKIQTHYFKILQGYFITSKITETGKRNY